MVTSAGKKIALFACAALAVLSLGACSTQSASSSATSASSGSASAAASTTTTQSSQATSAASAQSAATTAATSPTAASATFGAVPNTLAQDEDALVSKYAGMSEVEAMFDADSVAFASAEWDGTWTPDALTAAAEKLFASGNAANFVSWKTGTIEAGSGGGKGGSSYHMASFDYAYNCVAAMEWLFQQGK